MGFRIQDVGHIDEPPKHDEAGSKSLSVKIAMVMCLALLVIFMLIAKWVEVIQIDTIRADAEKETKALAETLHTGLRTLMLNGDGELTNEWLESIKNIGGIEFIQVIRKDGTQAFRNLDTIEAVNEFNGAELFKRQSIEPSKDFDASENRLPVAKLIKGDKEIVEHKDGIVKLWMPILKEESCNACHGYDESPLRGVLHIEISTASADASIAEMRKMLWVSAVAAALLIGVILWWLLNRIVLVPVGNLSQAMKDLSDGKTDAVMPVNRGDEIGSVARSFKQLERNWKIRSTRLSLILNSIPEAVLTVDHAGEILSVNKAGISMFGYDDENQMLGLNILNLLGPVSEGFSGQKNLKGVELSELKNTLRECVGFHRENGIFPAELEVCSIEENYLLFLSEVDLSDMEASKKYLFVLRDVTVRRRTEADMQLLATVVDQASEAIVISNPQGEIEYVNPAFYETTGYTAEEVMGENPRILKSGDRGEDYYKNMWDTLHKGVVWRDVFVNRRKDGTLYQSEQRIAPMHDSFGHISHFVSIQRDITKEKKLQEQVEHLQRLESLGVLAGGIAHDFNNILACVIGNAEMMAYDLPEGSRIHECLEHIQQAGKRGENLCLELMAYAGKGKRKTEPVDLSVVVHGITNILDTTATQQIHLDLQLSQELPMILADSTQLEQVVMNLVINATEAMESGKGRVVIETGIEEVSDEWFKGSSFHSEKLPAGKYVCLKVADNGSGMDNVTVNQIFDPFFTTKFTGRGLGMSAVLGIIQNHHGSLKCETEPGVGTTFTIIFPSLAQIPVPQESRVEKTAPAEQQFSGDGLVVVIDDEPAVGKVVGHMLERLGFQVMLVHDAREGLKLLESVEALAIVVDMSMPHMDGPSFIKSLRETDQTTPVVICSGDAKEDVLQRIGDESLYNCIIGKPFRLKDISECFTKILADHA